MTDMTVKTPWHLWAVGAIAVLWNGYGAYDYVMSMTGGAEYLTKMGMTPEQMAYYEAFPAWMTAVWAVGVWGALLGSLLLLLRRRLAFPVFALSFAAFLFSLFHTYVVAGAGEMMGYMMQDGQKVATPMIYVMNGVIAAGCAFFTWYAWTMGKKGVLR
ncbi:MAG: hypothetical protein K2X07_08895 [Caulobacteraceae bacterium]|nr:hypothetical protein [Caulobacteraceae bacterium]